MEASERQVDIKPDEDEQNTHFNNEAGDETDWHTDKEEQVNYDKSRVHLY
jgi:hypothetical protein